LSSASFHSVTPGDHGVFAVQPRLHQHRARRRIFVGQVDVFTRAALSLLSMAR
jgi:hypothetical protein